MDIKLICVNGFKLIELTEQNHYILDRPPNTLFNSMMVSQKGSLYLLKAIRQIVQNVNAKYYGPGPLSPTGPEMLFKVMMNNKIKLNIDMKHFIGGGYIIYKNRFIVSTEYPEYNNEINSAYDNINIKKYGVLWNERNIYK